MKKEQQMTMGVLTFLKTDNLEASKDFDLVNLYTNKGKSCDVIVDSLLNGSKQELELNKRAINAVNDIKLSIDFNSLEPVIMSQISEDEKKVEKELLEYEITPKTPKEKIIEKLKKEGVIVDVLYTIILKKYEWHPIVKLLLKKSDLVLRKNQFYTLKSIQGNGFIKTNYNVWGSLSGRIISYNPCTQNLPSIYKKYIHPSNEGDIIYELDIKCAEVIALASLGNETKVFTLLEKQEDIYEHIFKELFSKNEFTKEKRKLIKEITNAIFLGIGGEAVASRFNEKEFVKKKLSKQQGTEIKERIFKLFPNIKIYLDEIQKQDILVTGGGHKIKVNPSYKNLSFPAQNLIATILKMVLLELDHEGLSKYIINIVHDSIWISVPNEDVKNKIKNIFKNQFEYMLPEEFKNKDINILKESKLGECL